MADRQARRPGFRTIQPRTTPRRAHAPPPTGPRPAPDPAPRFCCRDCHHQRHGPRAPLLQVTSLRFPVWGRCLWSEDPGPVRWQLRGHARREGAVPGEAPHPTGVRREFGAAQRTGRRCHVHCIVFTAPQGLVLPCLRRPAASPLSRRPAQPGPWGAAGRGQAQARGAGGVSIKYIAFQEKKNGHVRNAARGAPKSRADQ